MAGVSLHEYSYNDCLLSGLPDLLGRFMELFRACDRNGIPRPQTFITECGWHYDHIGDHVMPDIVDAMNIYAHYPDIKGVYLWYLGGEFGNIANQLQPYISQVGYESVNYTYETPALPADAPPPIGESMPDCKGLPRVQYARDYVLLPPGVSEEMKAAAAAAAGNPEWLATVGYSADDAGVGDLQNKTAILVNPSSWPTYPGGMSAWFNTYYPGARCVEIVAGSPIDLIQKLLEYAGVIEPIPPSHVFDLPIPVLYSQRDTRWASVVMGVLAGEIKTIGNFGCIAAAYAMQAAQFGIAPIYTPETMWNKFKEVGATSGPLTRDGALETAFPGDVEYLGYETLAAVNYDRIRSHIRGGHSIIARVDFRPDTTLREEHWVLLYGFKEGENEFLCCDPWYGDQEWVNARYGIPGKDILTALYYIKVGTEPLPVSDPGIGLHANSSAQWQGPDFVEFANLRPEWVKVMTIHSSQDVSALLAQHPLAKVVVRVFQEFGGRAVTPQEFYDWNWPDVERLLSVCSGRTVVIELHNEPNLRSEGCFVAWLNGSGFNTWFKSTLALYRQKFPSAKFIFPGLSPGGDITNERIDDKVFFSACGPALASSDGLGVHAYWGVTSLAAAVDVVKWYRQAGNGKIIYVTESSHNVAGTPDQKARDYAQFIADLRPIPLVEAVIYFVVNSSHGAYPNETWVGKNLGTLTRAYIDGE